MLFSTQTSNGYDFLLPCPEKTRKGQHLFRFFYAFAAGRQIGRSEGIRKGRNNNMLFIFAYRYRIDRLKTITIAGNCIYMRY